MTFLQRVVSDLREWLGWDTRHDNFVLRPAFAVKRLPLAPTARVGSVRNPGSPCHG